MHVAMGTEALQFPEWDFCCSAYLQNFSTVIFKDFGMPVLQMQIHNKAGGSAQDCRNS
jgi:hypothetical protein